MSRFATSALAVVLLTAMIVACDSDDNGAVAPQGTAPERDTETSSKAPEERDTRAVKALKACLKNGGARVSSRVVGIPRRARRASPTGFMAKFPDAKFGPQVDDVAFLPFAQPALLKKTFIAVKPRLGKRRRVVLRSNLLVIFGTQNTAQVSELVLSCVGRPDERSK